MAPKYRFAFPILTAEWTKYVLFTEFSQLQRQGKAYLILVLDQLARQAVGIEISGWLPVIGRLGQSQ
jgi:hypothetical protein